MSRRGVKLPGRFAPFFVKYKRNFQFYFYKPLNNRQIKNIFVKCPFWGGTKDEQNRTRQIDLKKMLPTK